MRAIKKLIIATELLDRALLMYYEGDSYFASLHLAGAASELLGIYVKKCGGASSFECLRDTVVLLSKTDDLIDGDDVDLNHKNAADRINRAKNAIKHIALKGEDLVCFDAQAEAYAQLDLAVADYYYLMRFFDLEETNLLQRFNAELINK